MLLPARSALRIRFAPRSCRKLTAQYRDGATAQVRSIYRYGKSSSSAESCRRPDIRTFLWVRTNALPIPPGHILGPRGVSLAKPLRPRCAARVSIRRPMSRFPPYRLGHNGDWLPAIRARRLGFALSEGAGPRFVLRAPGSERSRRRENDDPKEH